MAELKRIAICDDEIGTCSDLEKIVLDFANRRALRIETEVFYSGESFYRSIREQCLYDLVFLDIQLLELDGVQVGRRIREQLGNSKYIPVRGGRNFMVPCGRYGSRWREKGFGSSISLIS